MKKVLIIILALIAIVVIAFLVYRSSESMDMPQGQAGPEADALAQKMMRACNSEAWDDTRFVAWTFAGMHDYVWDRSTSKVKVTSGDDWVIIDSSTGAGLSCSHSECAVDEEFLKEKAKKAWGKFCNDSFWLIAPLKAMAPNTRRERVMLDDKEALLVHYEQGGVTPGDSYLWYLNSEGLPYAYRMWTSVLPIDGMKATWGDWVQLHTGVLIATSHEMGPATLEMGNVRSGSSLAEIGLQDSDFE